MKPDEVDPDLNLLRPDLDLNQSYDGGGGVNKSIGIDLNEYVISFNYCYSNNNFSSFFDNHSSSALESDHYPNIFYYYLLTFVAPAVFTIFIVVGVIGNSLVVYVIASDRRMRGVTNILFLNLAVADISFLAICGPFNVYKYHAPGWPFGDVACRLVQFIVYVSAYVTIYTLVAISILRYLLVVRGRRTFVHRNRRNASALIAVLWIGVMALNVPTLLAHTTKTYYEYTYCGMAETAIKPIFITFFVFGYAVPLLLISGLYLLVVRYITHDKTSSLVPQQTRTRRACRVIVIVVVAFGVSWLPSHVNNLLATFAGLPEEDFYQVFRVLWNCMMYSNSCVNPFIYNYKSKEFRNSFQAIVVRCRRCCRSGMNGTPPGVRTSKKVVETAE